MAVIGDATRTTTAPQPTSRPSAAWYWVAALLAVAGFLIAGAWVVSAVIGLTDHVDRFARTAVPGQASAPIDSPGTYYLYFEGRGTPQLADLGVTIDDPSGRQVDLRPVASGILYDSADRAVGRTVGKFTAATAGTYRMTATGRADATIALGDDLADEILPPIIGAGALVLLSAGGAAVLALATGVRRSRPDARV